MSSVDEMISIILKNEGGFVNHPDDPGGATNYGITQKTLSEYYGRDATIDEVKDLDESVAREIYEKDYYFAPKLDQLPESIQAFIFDCAVNHGPRRAIKFVQKVCNKSGFKPVLAEDGAMGPNTKARAHHADHEMGHDFYAELIEERRKFYLGIIDAKPSQKVFLNGWMNRIKAFEAELAH